MKLWLRQAAKLQYLVVTVTLLLMACVLVGPPAAKASACAVPTSDYGTISNLSTNISAAATYRIWTRMAAADSTNNTYLLEVDGSSCYNIGGSSVPIYGSGSTTYFTSGSSNWISKTTDGNNVDLALASGTHTFKLIGNAPNVVVDRLVMTQDLACTPTDNGDNCANPADTTPPIVSITSPSNNATLASTTTVTAHATDDVLMSKVEFYVDGTKVGTDTSGSAGDYTYSLTPSSYSVGSHTLTAKAYDSSSNVTTSSNVTFSVADTTAPTISAVASSSISQATATITWTTNESAESLVQYGLTTSYGSTTTLDSAKVTSHSVGVSGLASNTTYHYKVISKDAAGNSASSGDATFETQAPAADTTAPTVSLTAPAAGAVVGSITVSANAGDNVGVAGVQFKLDGANLGSEDTSSPYSISWNTTGVSNGSHTLTAVARDAAGNTTTATNVTVTISNPSAYLNEDINQDGHVDILDFSLLANKFNQSGAGVGRADINGDGTVDLLDFSLLANKYGTV